MFVRSDGRRVETCPISGTIARGVDAIGDAEQIRQLLNSEKDEFELNMCTDVDRNDKARVCIPGTIKVLARRQIETYSKLFHTVDHVEGMKFPCAVDDGAVTSSEKSRSSNEEAAPLMPIAPGGALAIRMSRLHASGAKMAETRDNSIVQGRR